jgi:cell division protein FtsW (lipid II flippase)
VESIRGLTATPTKNSLSQLPQKLPQAMNSFIFNIIQTTMGVMGVVFYLYTFFVVVVNGYELCIGAGKSPFIPLPPQYLRILLKAKGLAGMG